MSTGDEEDRRCPTYRCMLRVGHVGECQLATKLDSDPRFSCRDKGRYTTEEIANGVAAEAYRKRGHWLRVYACDLCGGYHLTHKGALPKPGWRPPAPSKHVKAKRRYEERDRRRRR